MPTVDSVLQSVNWQALSLTTLLRVAVLVLVGMLAIKILMGIVDRMLEKAKAVSAIRTYIRSGVNVALWFLLALMVAGSLDIDVTSIIALLSVAGLAVSLALQNTLSNLAGGLMVLVSKPFLAGDYIEADGIAGTVSAVGLAYSTLVTVDNKEIFVPNSQIAAAKITNYTRLGKRRVELDVSASYDAKAQEVNRAVEEIFAQYPQILREPAPLVRVGSYGSSSITYEIRVWTLTQDYWDVYYGILGQLRDAFDRHGVEMTYDHLNVHILDRQ